MLLDNFPKVQKNLTLYEKVNMVCFEKNSRTYSMQAIPILSVYG